MAIAVTKPSPAQIKILALKSAAGEVLGEQSKRLRGLLSKALDGKKYVSFDDIQAQLSKLPDATRSSIALRQNEKVKEIEAFWRGRGVPLP